MTNPILAQAEKVLADLMSRYPHPLCPRIGKLADFGDLKVRLARQILFATSADLVEAAELVEVRG